MATNTNTRKPVTEAPQEEKPEVKAEPIQKPAAKKGPESVYTIAELARASRALFKTSHEIVTVALKQAGKEKATVKEAEIIINKFKNKEVK